MRCVRRGWGGCMAWRQSSINVKVLQQRDDMFAGTPETFLVTYQTRRAASDVARLFSRKDEI